MSSLVLTREHAASVAERLKKIKDVDRPQWGTLTPERMLRHLGLMFEISLGEASEPDKSNFLIRAIVPVLFFRLITTWPHGKMKGPASLTPPAEGDVAAERARLLASLERFLNEADLDPTRQTTHPFLGPTTLEYWRRVHGVHMNHHMRQFGV